MAANHHLPRRAALAALIGLCAVTGAFAQSSGNAPVAVASPTLSSGLALSELSTTVRPQDDFYGFVTQNWLKDHPIPADRTWWGTVPQLREDATTKLRGLLDDPSMASTEESMKALALYRSFMNEQLVNEKGVDPVRPLLADVAAAKDKASLAAVAGRLATIGVHSPISLYVQQDPKHSDRYALRATQSGLGLPDRDYYLATDERMTGIRQKYVEHMVKMFTLAGLDEPRARAEHILALETQLAQDQWERARLRDPEAQNNPRSIPEAIAMTPGFDWKSFLSEEDYAERVNGLIVNQPDYVQKFGTLWASTPLDVWKEYFQWRVLSATAPYLSQAFVDENFDFRGRTLQGLTEIEPRWKRGVGIVDGEIGDALGKVYVARYFSPEAKARMKALVGNLLLAYRQSINDLDWMTPATKAQAQDKLSKITVKVGYPDVWRSYTALVVKPDDLLGNIERAERFEHERNANKLGHPVDKTEWHMTPQTVNAYYNPSQNEIVFPAAILQPPAFNMAADDAENYGGIGAVIGHEISHGFDDSGSHFDGDGNLRNWWTAEDHERFKAKTDALAAQYDAYETVPGVHLNGHLTLGENIADLAGITIAFKAYEHTLDGKPSPVINGYSGEQRFYISFATFHESALRPNFAVMLAKTDPHSPGRFRTNGVVINQPGFYAAYHLKPGDSMFVPPEHRILIW